jgi:hypothetical protein
VGDGIGVFVGKGNGVFVGVDEGLLVGIIVDGKDGFGEQAAKIIEKERMTIFDFILFPN